MLFADITKRRGMEAALREREERTRPHNAALQAVVDGAPLAEMVTRLAAVIITSRRDARPEESRHNARPTGEGERA